MSPHPATEERLAPDEARFRARLFDAVLGLNAGRISWDDYDREFCGFGAVPRALHDLVFGIWNIYDPEYPGNRKNTPPEAIYRILLFLRSNERQPDKRKERGLWDPFPSAAAYAAAEAAFGAEVFARFVADGAPGCAPEALRAAIDDCLRNGPPPAPSRPPRRWLRRLVWLALAGVGFVVACNLAVLIAAAGRVTPVGRAADAPARRAAVVMGCVPKLRGGWDNPYFTARIEAAAALWRAGKVEALIVSGDNHVEWYDEPSEMKKALVAAGVPEDRIACDYAGFRTLDSVVRAKTIFGLDSFLVISQDFHVRRAIFLGRCRGLDVRGCAARGVPFGRLSSRTVVREPLARVAAVLDVLLGRRPRFGGPPVPLPAAP
jgi:SanA protein